MATPSLYVRCAGVRSNKRHGLCSDTDRVFYSESQYAASPYLVRVNFNSVSFVHRGTHVVERCFVFPERVLHAVLADFPATALKDTIRDTESLKRGRRPQKRSIWLSKHPHLCVLIRSDCLNVYSAAGEVFEVALPFQANQLVPIKGRGLLLQRSPAVQIPATSTKRPRDAAAVALARKNRRASTSNRGDNDRYKYGYIETGVPARPRYFTLKHPLDEVKPVALTSSKENVTGTSKKRFLSDSALDTVALLEEEGMSPLLVTFHCGEQRFCVFQMNRVETKSKSCSMPNVKVVDGPTWTRCRRKSDMEEVRVPIEPEWLAVPFWNSPRVTLVFAKPMDLSPIVSPSLITISSALPPSRTNVSSDSSKSSTKGAFIASDVDGFPLLCLIDKDAGTLFIKPLSQQQRSTDKHDHEISGVRILHCRDAVPIRQNDDRRSGEDGAGIKGHSRQGFVDIVVLQKTGTLMLYRAHQPLCRLVIPGKEPGDLDSDVTNENDSDRMRLVGSVQLYSVDRCDAYEIVFPNSCGNFGGKIWRCEHPLTIVSDPLLQQVFQVLECIVPPTTLCEFEVHVTCRAQLKAQCTSDEDGLVNGGIEWQAFRKCVLGLLPRRASSNNETCAASVLAGAAKDDENAAATASVLSSFDTLCQSEYHDIYQYKHAMLFATMKLPVAKSLAQLPSGNVEIEDSGMNEKQMSPRIEDYVKSIFVGLHLLSEELKLSITLFQQRLQLVSLLLDMGLQLGLDHFVTYYRDDNCILERQVRSKPFGLQSKRQTEGLLSFTTYGSVPDILVWLQTKMTVRTDRLAKFPALWDDSGHQWFRNDCFFRRRDNPLRRTEAICQAYELMFSGSEGCVPQLPTAQSNGFKLIVYLTQDPIGSALSLNELPVGICFPMLQTIRQVKHHPPPFITEDVCAFVGREDLSIASAENLVVDYSETDQHYDLASSLHNQRDQTEDDVRDDCDGLGDVICRSQSLFPADQRMKEVARLLRSSRPLCLKLEKTSDESDLDYAQQQQARLLLLCKRSMALSVARGMVTLGSFKASTAHTQIWRLHIPVLSFAGRKPPTNAVVELDLSGYAKELAYWPQFHNGCATSLRLPAHDLSGVINRHWIKYHRPSVNDPPQRSSDGTAANGQATTTRPGDTATCNLEEAYAAHAGLLLGLGLRGHLKCLSMADVYNYLSLSNEFVTVAIMLGMASTAARCRHMHKQQAAAASSVTSNDDSRCSSSAIEGAEMPSLETNHFFSGFPELSSSDTTPLLGTGLELALERSVSKMLCLHVPSLLPPPFGGFSVPASTQTAALLGLGILYQGTGYRLMTELLLTEIARSPSSSQFVENNGNAGLSMALFDQLEGYALAAGMALGLVLLGRGQTTTGDPGLADLKLEEKLHKYVVGCAVHYRDLNAAGTSLYRGRQWQAFGSGGNGVGPAVNCSIPSDGSPSVSLEAFPGAGRDTKHSNDRSGARGSGEYVNIGVTGSASALALAFMYMQTDNKTVAAQLAVPDTLILLEYVRPDMLLIRTLAKNLVMWSNISPTVQWIDQSEVPAQLYKAYKAIQDSKGDPLQHLSGSPSYSDLHAICEGYANIVTGACMSIGLRFAGTSNTLARATLRKYVLHFRELRSKVSSSLSSVLVRGSSNVVAAATELATVERCLAVCAQALALVDAGTGHVETLALLRSITLRQRVDEAMSYGNHMALSMAIGLLFLGGGRATVSRSKEAIAALVISLYPTPAMNTADNKFHLQAFRHLYVLAVDTSRLLETVDVSTKTTSAVNVRVDLYPSENGSLDETQPSYQVLRSPCLLPDMTSIKRLIISDPKFYPIEILTSPCEQMSVETKTVRTANSLRLDFLRNKNVIILKRRQRNNVGSFADSAEELKLLHEVHVEDHNGSSTSDDRLRRLFQLYFTAEGTVDGADECETGEDDQSLDTANWGSSWWSSQLSPRALKHVYDEVQLLLPPHLDVLYALFRLQQVPQLACATEVVNLSMFSAYCCLDVCVPPPSKEEDAVDDNVSGQMAKRALLSEFGVWLSHQTEEALGGLLHRTALDITSLASARVQLLREVTPAMSPTKRVQATMDAFFVNMLVRYFHGPSVTSLRIVERSRAADKDWKAKFQRVLTACSLVQPQLVGKTLPAQFQLSAFLDQDELTTREKTFWLRFVSFFLFSNRHLKTKE